MPLNHFIVQLNVNIVNLSSPSVCWWPPWDTLSWRISDFPKWAWWTWPLTCTRDTSRKTPGSFLISRCVFWSDAASFSTKIRVFLYVIYRSFCVGVWNSRVYRSWGDPPTGLREAGGLVGHGDHPVRVPGGLRAFLWRHARGAVWTGHQRSVLPSALPSRLVRTFKGTWVDGVGGGQRLGVGRGSGRGQRRSETKNPAAVQELSTGSSHPGQSD